MNILISLKEELIEQQPWLFNELNFKVGEDHYESDHFGNSLVTLESPLLRVRFIRDRGQIFLKVASPLDLKNWWDIDDFCEFILHKKIRPVFDLQAVAASLKENFSVLIECFGPKFRQTKRELQRRVKQRERNILKTAREK